jgi:hypothetical protein
MDKFSKYKKVVANELMDAKKSNAESKSLVNKMRS